MLVSRKGVLCVCVCVLGQRVRTGLEVEGRKLQTGKTEDARLTVELDT